MGQDYQSMEPVRSRHPSFSRTPRIATNVRSTPDQPLKSTHSLPERVYNLSYAPTTARLLVSMAHRHVSVYSLPTLAAATDGQDTKAEQNRESALKFLTRSVAVMADGKGACRLRLRLPSPKRIGIWG